MRQLVGVQLPSRIPRRGTPIGRAAVLRSPCFGVRIPTPVPCLGCGTIGSMKWTKEYARRYMHQLYQDQRDIFIEELGGKCRRCGSKSDLQFDHVDPNAKEFDVGRYWGKRTLEQVITELRKCQLLCGPCHRKKSAEEASARMSLYYKGVNGPDGFRHGTAFSWMKRKCQCPTCEEAKKSWHKARNERRRAASGSARAPYKKATHGSASMYGYHGCRCEVCRAGHTRRHMEYRNNKVTLE